jgi:ABC-type polysaccharide/polyol phosphate export permease
VRWPPGQLRISREASRLPVGRWLDALVTFLAFERFLIVRSMRITSKGNVAKAFTGSLQVYLVVLAHAYLFWFLKRDLPASISYLDYFIGAFAMWRMFGTAARRGVPSTLALASNAPLRVRWIHLVIADLTWDMMKILIGICVIYGQYALFPALYLTGTLRIPNIPLLFSLFLLAALLGTGVGIVLQTIRTQWSVADASIQPIMWLLFITSGIYESYVRLPPLLAQYFRLNPILAVIEYARVALDPGYPVGTLDLRYPLALALSLIAIGLLLRRSRLVKAAH